MVEAASVVRATNPAESKAKVHLIPDLLTVGRDELASRIDSSYRGVAGMEAIPDGYKPLEVGRVVGAASARAVSKLLVVLRLAADRLQAVRIPKDVDVHLEGSIRQR